MSELMYFDFTIHVLYCFLICSDVLHGTSVFALCWNTVNMDGIYIYDQNFFITFPLMFNGAISRHNDD